MRVLFVTHTNKSHLWLQVPLAWAFRNSGHDVRVAGQPEIMDEIMRVGLTAVSVGKPTHGLETMHEETKPAGPTSQSGGPRQRMPHVSEYAQEDPLAELEDIVWNGCSLFAPQSMVDDLVAVCQSWKPDLVIWDEITFAGGVAAKVAGAAHARILFSSDGFAHLRNLISARHGEGHPDPFREWLEPMMQRFDRTYGEDNVVGQWTIDPAPPWHWRPAGTNPLSMRSIPFHGGSQTPQWLYDEPPSRPRVCITLGTTHREFLGYGTASPAALLEAVADLDVEVIATFNEEQLKDVPAIPDNVRVFDYVPLNALLPSCSAIVHHGGAGSYAAALENAVPQLVIPTTYRYLTWWGPIGMANALQEQGAGLFVADSDHFTSEALREDLTRVLNDPSFADNARRSRAALAAVPGPAEIAAKLEELATEHHGGAVS